MSPRLTPPTARARNARAVAAWIDLYGERATNGPRERREGRKRGAGALSVCPNPGGGGPFAPTPVGEGRGEGRAVSARAHVGAIADDLGRGVQVGATLGFGVSGERTGVMLTPGVVTGNAPRLGIADGIEVVRLPERRGAPYAWRAGFGDAIAVVGEPTVLGPHAAVMWLASDRRRSWSGHEKMGGGGASRDVLGVGIEGRVGMSVRELESSRQSGLGASAALTVEWIRLSRWRCC